MQLRRYLVVCSAMLSLSVLVFSPQVTAAPNTCSGGQYTVTFDNGAPDTTTSPGNAIWKYTIIANQTALSSVKQAVIIIPRPVTPFHVISPPAGNFCAELDSNTKINRGNCNGFVVGNTALTRSGSTLKVQFVTLNTVTTSLVSLNVVSGSASSDVCVNTDDLNNPKGIPGPGALGDSSLIFQTFRRFERTNNQGQKCTTDFTLDISGNVISAVRTCGSTQITLTGTPFSQILIDIGNGPEVLRQVGKDGDFVEILSGQNSSCTVYYRNVQYQIC